MEWRDTQNIGKAQRAAIAVFLILAISVMPASATSQSEIQMMINTAAKRYSMDPVRFHIVGPDHKLFKRDPAIAKAVRWQDGDEAIYIVSTRAKSQSALLVVIDHEMSHLKAWRTHGESIKVHGYQWKSTCRKYSAFGSRACYKSFQ